MACIPSFLRRSNRYRRTSRRSVAITAGAATSIPASMVLFAGVTASNGHWRIEGDAIGMASEETASSGLLTVDVNLIYGHGSLGRRLLPTRF